MRLQWANDHVGWGLRTFLPKSLGSVSISLIDVLESGEGEMNVFRQFVLLSMTAMAVVQLWFGQA